MLERLNARNREIGTNTTLPELWECEEAVAQARQVRATRTKQKSAQPLARAVDWNATELTQARQKTKQEKPRIL